MATPELSRHPAQEKRDSMSDSENQKPKVTIEQLAQDGPRKPEWLANIDEQELARRNRKLVRKMDLIIL